MVFTTDANYGALYQDFGEARLPWWPVWFPVYASIILVGVCLRNNCNIRYEWLVRLCSAGTFTLQETPSFAWRTNGWRTGKGGIWRKKSPDAESAVEAASPKEERFIIIEKKGEW